MNLYVDTSDIRLNTSFYSLSTVQRPMQYLEQQKRIFESILYATSQIFMLLQLQPLKQGT